jgi:hypothetical protein
MDRQPHGPEDWEWLFPLKGRWLRYGAFGSLVFILAACVWIRPALALLTGLGLFLFVCGGGFSWLAGATGFELIRTACDELRVAWAASSCASPDRRQRHVKRVRACVSAATNAIAGLVLLVIAAGLPIGSLLVFLLH